MHIKKGRVVDFAHPEKLSFSVKFVEFGKNFFIVKPKDISAQLQARSDFRAFLKDLDVFTFEEFVRVLKQSDG